MKSPLFTAAAVACAFASVASAQTPSQVAAPSVPGATKATQGSIAVQPSTPGGSFLVGPNDLCANATAISGTGPFAFDNTGAGTDGPSNCGALGADVWFTWTAAATGGHVLSICGGASYDSAISVYDGASCTPGTLLLCNDDFCGLQSQGTFSAVNGQQYKIQIGGFASSQGTGSFTINALPPCGGGCTLDDGSSENMLGWTAGGDMGWIQRFGTTGPTSLSSVQVAWGSAAFPGLSPGNGSPSKVLVYEDPNDDGNPNDLVLVQQINTTVVNVDTDTLNNYPVTPVVMNGTFFLGAGEVHPSGNYVAIMDQTAPSTCGDLTYFFGDNTGAAANYANPNANIFPPQTFAGIGFPTNLLVRGGCNASPFTAVCLPGQGGIIACPCGNPPAGGGLGCNNFGAGPTASGTLAGSGNNSLSGDTIVLAASGENNTSLTVFWQGHDPLSSTGIAHAAGVRCVTATLKRLYTGNASAGAISRPGMGDPSVSARSAAVGDPISAGQNRHYFTIYRDPSAAGPCGNTASTVNLTNAGTISWGP